MSSLRKKIELGSLVGLAGVFRLLPRSAALYIGERLGETVFILRIRRDVTVDNLIHAFPELSDRECKKLARQCYQHFGALLVEFARQPLLRKENAFNLVEFKGRDILDGALTKGKGGIVVSGHFGNWELMGASASVLGYPVHYIVTHQENELVEEFMDDIRRNSGIGIVKKEFAIKEVLRILHNNGLIAILCDQDAHEAGAFVPFFGRLASTPRGAAAFALRSGAEVIFAEAVRRGTDRLYVTYETVATANLPADRDSAIIELTRRITTRLEQAVRNHPEQWFWMHRRWKTPPPVDIKDQAPL